MTWFKLYPSKLVSLLAMSDEELGTVFRLMLVSLISQEKGSCDIADEMLDQYQVDREKRASAGRSGGLAKSSNAKAMPSDALAKASREDKIREDKSRRKEKDRRKIFSPPSLKEVEDYATEKGKPHLAKPFYEYFDEGDWKDAKGLKVVSWRQKFLTWCSYDAKSPGRLSSSSTFLIDHIAKMRGG